MAILALLGAYVRGQISYIMGEGVTHRYLNIRFGHARGACFLDRVRSWVAYGHVSWTGDHAKYGRAKSCKSCKIMQHLVVF